MEKIFSQSERVLQSKTRGIFWFAFKNFKWFYDLGNRLLPQNALKVICLERKAVPCLRKMYRHSSGLHHFSIVSVQHYKAKYLVDNLFYDPNLSGWTYSGLPKYWEHQHPTPDYRVNVRSGYDVLGINYWKIHWKPNTTIFQLKPHLWQSKINSTKVLRMTN